MVDGSQPPEWIAAGSLRNRVVAIRQNKRFYFYDSLLQSLFVNNLVWENEMDRVVYNHGRIDRLISLSEETMGNFVCVTDTGYNLIAYSRGIEPPGEGFRHLVDNNCYDRCEVAEIEGKVLERKPSSLYASPTKGIRTPPSTTPSSSTTPTFSMSCSPAHGDR